jgi:hypothetical protein
MKQILLNWKTTTSGLSTIVGGVFMCMHHNYEAGITAILGGIGLILATDATQQANG